MLVFGGLAVFGRLLIGVPLRHSRSFNVCGLGTGKNTTL